MVAEHPAGGAWSTPVPVAPANVGGNRLAVGPDGTLAIVYQSVVAGKIVVGAVVRPAGGSWSAPQVLSDPTKTSYGPQVAVGAGVVTAVWVQGNGAASNVLVSSRPVGAAGTWGASPTTFAETGVAGADVAASPAGTLVTWVLSSDPSTRTPRAPSGRASTARRARGRHRCHSRRPGAGSRWPSRPSAPTARWPYLGVAAAHDGGLLHLGPHAGCDPDARGHLGDPGGAVRSRHRGPRPERRDRSRRRDDGGVGVLRRRQQKVATRVHRGGSWEPEIDLTESVDFQSDPRLAIGPDGTAVVEFSDLENGIGVAIRPPGSAWRPTDFIAPAAKAGYSRALAVGSDTVAVVWTFGNDDVLLAVVADHLRHSPRYRGSRLARRAARTGRR